MAQQQHRGPEARKIELERRLDENEKTVSRGLASDKPEAEKKQASAQQQQSEGPNRQDQLGASHRSGQANAGNGKGRDE